MLPDMLFAYIPLIAFDHLSLYKQKHLGQSVAVCGARCISDAVILQSNVYTHIFLFAKVISVLSNILFMLSMYKLGSLSKIHGINEKEGESESST